MELSHKLVEAEYHIKSQEEKLTHSATELESIEHELEAYKSLFKEENKKRAQELRETLAQLSQQEIGLTEEVKSKTIRAPINGIIDDLIVHTILAPVLPGQQLMRLIPLNEPLEMEATIPNKEIAFIEIGQKALIRFDAFPFERYGGIEGEITSISKTSKLNEDGSYVYTVRIQFDRYKFCVDCKNASITTGMTAAIDIKIGKRRIVDYILSPIIKPVRLAMREQ